MGAQYLLAESFCSKIQWNTSSLKEFQGKSVESKRKVLVEGFSLVQNTHGPLESQCSRLSYKGKEKGGKEVQKDPLATLSPSCQALGPGSEVHCLQLSGCFVPVGPAPTQGPFGLSFFLFQKTRGGPRAQWLDSQVASQRSCCPIERHVESQGEREEDIINPEL